MRSLPILNPYHVSAALLPPLALRERATVKTSSCRSLYTCRGLSFHELAPAPSHFQFHARDHIAVQAISDPAHRHSSDLSKIASPDGFKTIGKRLDNGQNIFAEATKTHD